MRSHSFAVESTRYCNYSRDKFNNEVTFIQPYWYDEKDLNEYIRIISGKNWLSAEIPDKVNRAGMFNGYLENAEETYLELIHLGAKPQEAREVLPLATKCDMIMTGFVSDWKHFFRLRTSILAETGKPHPDASALANPLYKEFIDRNYMESL